MILNSKTIHQFYNITNLNNAPDGYFIASNISGISNLPQSNRYVIFTFTVFDQSGSIRKTQFAYGLNEFWLRHYAQPTWYTWRTVVWRET